MSAAGFLEVQDLKVHFPAGRTSLLGRKRYVHAVDGISFAVPRQSSFGIVGESGSGKSTAAQAIMRLVPITEGTVRLGGTDLAALSGNELRTARRQFQMIFQDPFSALNPRQRAEDDIREPLDLFHVGTGKERAERVKFLFNAVGLPLEAAKLFPHQFSGGQRQRLMIARVLSSSPDIIICDEPVSSLDVAIQAQVLNILKRLQREFGLTLMFISHNLGVIQYICDQVGVMYLGQLVERAPSEALFSSPRHPYTWALIAAASSPGPLRVALKQRFTMNGEPPSPIDPPLGCRIAARCPFALDRCVQENPFLADCGDQHVVACHRANEVAVIGEAAIASAGGYLGLDGWHGRKRLDDSRR